MKRRLAGDASPIRRLCLDWSRQAPISELEWVIFDPAGIASGLQSLPDRFLRCNNLLKHKRDFLPRCTICMQPG